MLRSLGRYQVGKWGAVNGTKGGQTHHWIGCLTKLSFWDSLFHPRRDTWKSRSFPTGGRRRQFKRSIRCAMSSLQLNSSHSTAFNLIHARLQVLDILFQIWQSIGRIFHCRWSLPSLHLIPYPSSFVNPEEENSKQNYRQYASHHYHTNISCSHRMTTWTTTGVGRIKCSQVWT